MPYMRRHDVASAAAHTEKAADNVIVGIIIAWADYFAIARLHIALLVHQRPALNTFAAPFSRCGLHQAMPARSQI